MMQLQRWLIGQTELENDLIHSRDAIRHAIEHGVQHLEVFNNGVWAPYQDNYHYICIPLCRIRKKKPLPFDTIRVFAEIKHDNNVIGVIACDGAGITVHSGGIRENVYLSYEKLTEGYMYRNPMDTDFKPCHL
ncbi:MAG: hypothetical protein KGI50_05825 [Patescibacteria group bacterium]|nr:hypothetical protein [Patescibacteria group bacterium]MDE2438795.1 hypothetical protein [Patescibacteria group bacterium]